MTIALHPRATDASRKRAVPPLVGAGMRLIIIWPRKIGDGGMVLCHKEFKQYIFGKLAHGTWRWWAYSLGC